MLDFLSTSPKLKLLSVHAVTDSSDMWVTRNMAHITEPGHNGLQETSECLACIISYDHGLLAMREDTSCYELARALPRLLEVRFRDLYSKKRGESGQRSVFVLRDGLEIKLSRHGTRCL